MNAGDFERVKTAAMTFAAMGGKIRQFVNGVYYEDGRWSAAANRCACPLGALVICEQPTPGRNRPRSLYCVLDESGLLEDVNITRILWFMRCFDGQVPRGMRDAPGGLRAWGEAGIRMRRELIREGVEVLG